MTTRKALLPLAVAFSAMALASAQASTFNTLYQFPGGSSGSVDFAGLVEDAAGVFYRETFQGGTTSCASHYANPIFGCGTLFSFSRTAGLTTLATFTGSNGAYGGNTPSLIGSTLYASTIAGGTTDNGVIFSVRKDGTGFKLLHQFTGMDGSEPSGKLVQGPGHVLYGVAAQGGPAFPKRSWGVLFRLAADGTFTILHSFTNGADGGTPNALVVEKNGVIVGSAASGGNKSKYCGSVGCGVVYEFDTRTSQFAVLQTFFASPHGNGTQPVLGSLGPDGTVYGNGTPFFSIGPKTGFTLLPPINSVDVGFGNLGPILGPSGSLTSVTPYGNACGSCSPTTLYQQQNSVTTVLHYFDGNNGSGFNPKSAPLLTPIGSFVGTTSAGGAACSCGTIYEYVP